MNDPRQPQSVPLPPIPQRPLPTPQQPLRSPGQQMPQGQPNTLRPPTAAPAMPASRPVPAMPVARPVPVIPAARPAPPQAPQPAQPAADAPMELDPIDLEDEQPEELAPSTGATKIKFGADGMMKKHAWKRATTSTGLGACRVRTFHGKLSDQGLEYLDEAINTFLDEHPEIEIKHVTTNVGMFDGKFKDFAMIVNVWY